MNEILIPNAGLYAARNQLELAEPLGSGKDGIVLVAKHKAKPADVWADWEADKREQFEGRWPAVQKVLSAFEDLGIYLLDVSPGNIAFLD